LNSFSLNIVIYGRFFFSKRKKSRCRELDENGESAFKVTEHLSFFEKVNTFFEKLNTFALDNRGKDLEFGQLSKLIPPFFFGFPFRASFPPLATTSCPIRTWSHQHLDRKIKLGWDQVRNWSQWVPSNLARPPSVLFGPDPISNLLFFFTHPFLYLPESLCNDRASVGMRFGLDICPYLISLFFFGSHSNTFVQALSSVLERSWPSSCTKRWLWLGSVRNQSR